MGNDIFISYGREDASEVAEWLSRSLKARGFSVWLDREQLADAGGAEWERQIEQAIRKVPIVIALLSPRAVRPNGECRNEISLARDLDCRIVPVMVKQCERPLRIHALQFIDLEEFARMPDGLRVQQLDRIVAAIEKGVPEEPALVDARKLLPKLDFEWMFSRHASFVGREWLFDKFDSWMRDDGDPVLFVVGQPGVGKSAALSTWVQTRMDIGAIHFCRSDRSDLRNPGIFVGSIVRQLLSIERELPGYLHTVMAESRDLMGIEIDPSRASALFDRLVLDPLRSLRGGRRWVLTVDALDEGGPGIQQLLAGARDSLPSNFRLLVSSRPDPGVLGLFPTRTEIDAQGSENLSDLSALVSDRIGRSKRLVEKSERAKEALAARVVTNSGGLFAHAILALEHFEAGRASEQDLADKYFGDDGQYLRYFKKQFATLDDYEPVAACLAVIAACPEPVSDAHIAAMLDRTVRSVSVALNRLGSMMPVVQGRRVAYHKSFMDWILCRSGGDHDFVVTVQDGLQAMQRWAKRVDSLEALELEGDSLSSANEPLQAEAAYRAAFTIVQDVATHVRLRIARKWAAVAAADPNREVGSKRASIALREALRLPGLGDRERYGLLDALSGVNGLLTNSVFVRGYDCSNRVSFAIQRLPSTRERERLVGVYAQSRARFTKLVRHAFSGEDLRGSLMDPIDAHVHTIERIKTLVKDGGGAIFDGVLISDGLCASIDVLRVTETGIIDVFGIVPRIVRRESSSPAEMDASDVRSSKWDDRISARKFNFMLPSGNGIRSAWEHDMVDLAYRTLVTRYAVAAAGISEVSVRSSLITIDGTAQTGISDGLGNLPIDDEQAVARGRVTSTDVKWVKEPSPGWASALIAVVDVDECVEEVFSEFSLEPMMAKVAQVVRGTLPEPSAEKRSWRCRSCEFRLRSGSVVSGFERCWGAGAPSAANLLSLYRGSGYGGRSSNWLPETVDQHRGSAPLTIGGLAVEQTSNGASILSFMRNLQILAEKTGEPQFGQGFPGFGQSEIGREAKVGAVHFLSIEAVQPVIPLSGMRAANAIPMCFSCHSLSSSGSAPEQGAVRHRSWIFPIGGSNEADVSEDLLFVDQLLRAVGTDDSRVFVWGSYLTSILRTICTRIAANQNAETSRDDERNLFINSLCQSREPEPREISGPMTAIRFFDLMSVARLPGTGFMLPGQGGSFAMSRVLRSVVAEDASWERLSTLMGEEMRDARGVSRDPFELIPRVPTVGVGFRKSSEQSVIASPNGGKHTSAAEDKSESVLDESDLEDGSENQDMGRVFEYLRFPDVAKASSVDVNAVSNAVLTRCKLKSAAVLTVWDWMNRHGRSGE
ncbi:MAG: hypothetical protein RIR77_2088 [Planctomycetota bacterium]|jgi:hypothetical protein